MKITKITSIALAATLTLSSCSDFLTEVNPNAITTETFWKNLNDTDKGLTAVYHAFRSPNIYQIVPDHNRSDLTYPGYGRPSTTNPFWLHTYTDASSEINNKWSHLYRGVFRTNQVITALNNIKPDMVTEAEIEDWTIQMAQARFFRGLFHYWLNISFNNGDVIKYDFVPKDLADFRQPLSKSADVMAFYREDMKYAHENLPLEWKDAMELGRVTKGTAASFLGQSYLYEKDYEQAKTYFREVIESGVYELVDVSMNSTTKGEFNKESILEVSYTLNHNSEFNQWSEEALHNMTNMSTSPVGGWRTIIPSAWLTMAYKEDQRDLKNPCYQITDPETGEVTGYHRYSMRTSYSLALVDDENIEYYGYLAANAPYNNKEYAYFRKNSNWDICKSEKDLMEKSGVNYRVMRLADVYLMYAEALIQGGQDESGVAEALKYINRVRHRAAVQLLGTGDEAMVEFAKTAVTFNDSTYTATEVMDHLMYIERPLELAVEGYSTRQIDLRRWGITKQRFEELSRMLFSVQDEKNAQGYVTAYKFIDKNGKEVSKWGSRLKHYNPAIHDNQNDIIVDFQQAAGNYNDDQHAYYPIPNSESMANGNLYK